MRKVFVARNAPEAHLCVAALQAEGIDAVIQGEGLSGAQGGIPVGAATAPSVWIVNDEDAQTAAMVIARFHSTEGGTVPPESPLRRSIGLSGFVRWVIAA